MLFSHARPAKGVGGFPDMSEITFDMSGISGKPWNVKGMGHAHAVDYLEFWRPLAFGFSSFVDKLL